MQKFYRVCNTQSEQGLWYNFQGEFTGLIHEKFDFCTHKDLRMDFDSELCGWLSATKTLEELYNWFPNEDIMRLQDHGWFISEYEATKYKFYDRFQHWVICQESSKPLRSIHLPKPKMININLTLNAL